MVGEGTEPGAEVSIEDLDAAPTDFLLDPEEEAASSETELAEETTDARRLAALLTSNSESRPWRLRGVDRLTLSTVLSRVYDG